MEKAKWYRSKQIDGGEELTNQDGKEGEAEGEAGEMESRGARSV